MEVWIRLQDSNRRRQEVLIVKHALLISRQEALIPKPFGLILAKAKRLRPEVLNVSPRRKARRSLWTVRPTWSTP